MRLFRYLAWRAFALVSSVLVAFGISVSTQVDAQTVLAVTSDEPSGWVVIYNGQAFASSWSQTNGFTNVAVSAELSSFGVPGQTGRAYLTRRIGPGTTVSDEVASTQFTFPLDLTYVLLFRNLTLPPGTYYLSMVGEGPSGSGWFTGCAATVDAADGVLLGLDYGIYGIAPYLPASSGGPHPTIFMRFKVVVETNPPPSPPVPIQANLHTYVTPSEILLTWDPVPCAVRYEIHRAGADLRWSPVSDNVTTTSFRDDNLSLPTNYRVIAVTAAGERFVSESISVPFIYLMIQLSGISVRPISNTSVSIDWSVNEFSYNQIGLPAPGGARALLEMGPSPSELNHVEWGSTYAQSGHYLLTNLASATTYWYRLTITGTNDSGFSYLNTFTTRPAPAIEHRSISISESLPVLVVEEDTPVSFTLTADESHNPPLSFTITTQPGRGVITGDSHEFLYTPGPDWDGPDIFLYSAFDGVSTISGTVFVTILPANDAPVTVDPRIGTVDEDSWFQLPFQGRDPDAPFSEVTGFTLVSGPENGVIEAGAYIPNQNFNGIDRVTYRAKDAQAEGNLVTMRIRVEPVDDPPVTLDQNVIVFENTPQTISLQASDPDDSSLGLFFTVAPSHGMLSAASIEVFDISTCHGLSDLIYTPTPGFTGTDRIEYIVSARNRAALGSVSIQVVSPNRSPQAIGQSLFTEFGIALPVVLSGTDPDGDSLTFSVVNPPSHGTLSGVPPQLIYTPAPGYAGSDAFAFVANDGRVASIPAEIAITILADEAVPMAPTGLTAVATSGHRIDLAWTDQSSYEKGFRIERSTDGVVYKQIASVNANVATYSDGGVQLGKTYFYRVRAYNKQGNSTYSNAASATP